MPAAGHSGPPPSGTRPLRFVPRHSRFRLTPGETLPNAVQARRTLRCSESRSRVSSAARAGRALPSSRRPRERSARGASFDHLVGAGEDGWWDAEPERLCRLQIDDQLKRRRLLDGQIGGLGAVEDLSGINAGLAKGGEVAVGIA